MPIFLLIYYTVPEKYGNLILFLGSLFFYAYGEHRFFWLILVSLVIHYALTRYSQGKSLEMSEDLSGGHACVWLWHAVYI